MLQMEKNYRKIFYTKTFAYPLRKIKQRLDDGARATTVCKNRLVAERERSLFAPLTIQ
jgi:hypothetical protein